MKTLLILLLVVSNFLFVNKVESKPQKEETNNNDTENYLNVEDINEKIAQQFLAGEITVDNYEGKKTVTIYELVYMGTPTKYAFVDLDGDGARELVIEYDPTGDRAIIDITDGVSTAYYLPIRWYNDIKKDGTANWSASAFDNGICKISFFDGQVEFEDIIVHNTYEGIFKVNGKHVSEEECNKALALQSEKESVEWIDIE